ncbi:unnamed protein product [Euphydryas editha]|uniref:Uncharacterized protein n=1 Tax=Euphydryas editha TaxID=104508 RepID=A0AAU9UE44_EUPED|nr:unnamed protein product [Euphydryas editha]
MYGLIRFLIIAFVLKVASALLDEKISNHFQSDVFTDFQKHWQLYRKSYENAIILALKDSYGQKGMNIYVRRSDDSLRISDGFYLTDNVVDLMLLDMTLTSLPYLTNPKVTFALASNVLTVEAGLSKMIVETRYLLFRNQSDILNTSLQDAYENSPFSFQQVENIGHLVIVAEDCMLVGYTLAKLSGHSVNLGHDTFQVRNCKFSIEISSYRPGFPPVIAPYFSKEQGASLELLLTKPIHEEFMPKFQAAVFSYVNTSLIFGEHLSKFRQYQDNIFREVSKNVTGLVRFLNNLTTASEQETINVDPLEVSWNVLVRGSILFKNDTLKEEYSFVAELKDITQNIEIDYNKLKFLFKFSNWRKMELSVIEVEKTLRTRKVHTAFVSGYLMNKLPKVLEKYFSIHLQSGGSQEPKLGGCVDVFTDFQKHWQLYRKSYENAIILALKDSYGHKGMNIYVRRSDDSLRISDGFYLTDNVVDLMLLDMTLTSLPYLTNPKVTFALASNVLTVEAGLSKMIVETRYLLFRNQSDILNTSLQDAYENSPFSFQQVENIGHLVIVAEDCMLVGYTLAKLSGHSVNLGHDTFQVRNCKFSIEISSYRPGFPPVIAPYFSKEQGASLELLLTKPIHEEFMPKFQAAVFSYVNTSLIFGEYLSKFRQYQDNIFREVSKNVTGLVRFLNNLTTASEQETINVDPLEVSWNALCQQGSCWNSFLIHNVTLHGLDTLYSSHNGGPFKLQSPLVAEALRFDSIMVRGSILFKNDTLKEEYSFVAELKDVTQNIEIDYNKLKLLFKFSNWR